MGLLHNNAKLLVPFTGTLATVRWTTLEPTSGLQILPSSLKKQDEW